MSAFEMELAAAGRQSRSSLLDFLSRGLEAEGLLLGDSQLGRLVDVLHLPHLRPAVVSLLQRDQEPCGAGRSDQRTCTRCGQFFEQPPSRDRTVCQGCESELDSAFARFESQTLKPLRAEDPTQEEDVTACIECGDPIEALHGSSRLCSDCDARARGEALS